jgi:hypothetical protein
MAFDKHIPAPKVVHPKFRLMDVGDSVFVQHEGSLMTCKAYMYAATIQKRSNVYKFSGRSVTEDGVRGVRIWRVA